MRQPQKSRARRCSRSVTLHGVIGLAFADDIVPTPLAPSTPDPNSAQNLNAFPFGARSRGPAASRPRGKVGGAHDRHDQGHGPAFADQCAKLHPCPVRARWSWLTASRVGSAPSDVVVDTSNFR